MKRILFFLLILFSLSAGAQTTQYLGAPNTIIHQRGIIRNDSADFIPADTIMRASWPKTLPAVAGKNGVLYYWSTTLQKWVSTGSTYTAGYGFNLSNNAFSLNMTQIGDSLPTFYKQDGTMASNRNVWLNGKYLAFNDHSFNVQFDRQHSFWKHDNGNQSGKWDFYMDSLSNRSTLSFQASSTTRVLDMVLDVHGDDGSFQVATNDGYLDLSSIGGGFTSSNGKGLLVHTNGADTLRGDVTLNNYPSTRNDGTTTKAFYPDANGNIKLGTISGGSSYTPTITTFSSSTTLTTAYETWVFTGTSAATATLPASGTRYFIKSRGTGTLTVSGSLYTNAATSSLTILNGDAIQLAWDGTKWNVL